MKTQEIHPTARFVETLSEHYPIATSQILIFLGGYSFTMIKGWIGLEHVDIIEGVGAGDNFFDHALITLLVGLLIGVIFLENFFQNLAGRKSLRYLFINFFILFSLWLPCFLFVHLAMNTGETSPSLSLLLHALQTAIIWSNFTLVCLYVFLAWVLWKKAIKRIFPLP